MCAGLLGTTYEGCRDAVQVLGTLSKIRVSPLHVGGRARGRMISNARKISLEKDIIQEDRSDVSAAYVCITYLTPSGNGSNMTF